MAFKMKGFTPFNKIKVEEASMASAAPSASAAGASMSYEEYQDFLAKNPSKPKIERVSKKENGPKDKKKPVDDDSEQMSKLQKLKGRIQRNKYNKKALKNKPLSEAQIQNLTKQINNPNSSPESIKEFKKLLKLNKKINK